MCHLEARWLPELKQNWRLYRESRRQVHVHGKGMRSARTGKGEQRSIVPQVAVSLTATNVWLDALGIGSATSVSLGADLISAAFRKVV